MDCGTCETAPAIQVHAPDVVDVELTLTEKATDMLEDALSLIHISEPTSPRLMSYAGVGLEKE